MMLPDLPVHHRFLPKLFLLADKRLAAPEQEFEMLLARGIIRPSSSQWTRPLYLVPELAHHRVLSRLNSHYPPPVSKDLLQNYQGFFYYRPPLRFLPNTGRAVNVEKAAVTTPFDLFQFVGMPLGIRNSAQTMNHLLQKLPFVKCYEDDIIVSSCNYEKHRQNLCQFFSALRDAKLISLGQKMLLNYGAFSECSTFIDVASLTRPTGKLGSPNC